MPVLDRAERPDPSPDVGGGSGDLDALVERGGGGRAYGQDDGDEERKTLTHGNSAVDDLLLRKLTLCIQSYFTPRALESPCPLAWFINSKIATKIILGFGVVIAIGLLVGAITFQSLSRISTSQEWTTHTYQVLAASRRLTISVLTEASASRAYRLGGDKALRARAADAEGTLDALLSRIKTLTADNASQQTRLAGLAGSIQAWHLLVRSDNGVVTGAEGAKIAREEALLDAMLVQLRQVMAEEDRLLGTRTQAGNDAFAWGYLVSGIGPVFALVIAALLGFALHARWRVSPTRCEGWRPAIRRCTCRLSAARTRSARWAARCRCSAMR